jgi:hypothetical protein
VKPRSVADTRARTAAAVKKHREVSITRNVIDNVISWPKDVKRPKSTPEPMGEHLTGLSRSRAYELIANAGGIPEKVKPRSVADTRARTAAAMKKHREVSVTRNVTDNVIPWPKDIKRPKSTPVRLGGLDAVMILTMNPPADPLSSYQCLRTLKRAVFRAF